MTTKAQTRSGTGASGSTEVQVKVFDAIWYKVSHGSLLRIVIVRGWPGHDKDDVLVSTDLSLRALAIIEGYCQR